MLNSSVRSIKFYASFSMKKYAFANIIRILKFVKETYLNAIFLFATFTLHNA